MVDERMNLFGVDGRNICIAPDRVTAPFLCEVDKWSLPI